MKISEKMKYFSLLEESVSLQTNFQNPVDLAEVRRLLEKQNRSPEENSQVLDFVLEKCQDPTVKQWLTEHYTGLIGFELVNMFNNLRKKLDEEKKNKKINREDIDIVFVSHGSVKEFRIPASCLLPLPSIKDVVLYSPWNCAIDATAAYGIATGDIQPQDRRFFSMTSGHQVPEPRPLPNDWNYMRAAGNTGIPTIMVSPLRPPGDKAWTQFMLYVTKRGEPGVNRVLLPFLLPEGINPTLKIPFAVVTLVLSVVLLVFGYTATVHLAACLNRDGHLSTDDLKWQYAVTPDNTMMKGREIHGNSFNGLFRACKAAFG